MNDLEWFKRAIKAEIRKTKEDVAAAGNDVELSEFFRGKLNGLRIALRMLRAEYRRELTGGDESENRYEFVNRDL